MRKNFLIYRIIFSFFILTFSSCVNHDFDLDDGKLDTNVAFGDGISLPVGNIEISIYDKLLEVYDDTIGVGDDNVLYVQYGGTFPVNFPEITVDEIKINPLCEISFSTDHDTHLQRGQTFEIIKEGTIENVLKEPEPTDPTLSLDPINILFGSCTLNISFEEFSGITLNAADAELIVTLTFSDKFRIKGKGAGMSNDTTIRVPLRSDKPKGPIPVGQIEVESYTFGGKSDLTYSVDLDPGSATLLTPKSPNIRLFINGQPKISSLTCHLSGEKKFEGEKIEFSDLQDAFGKEDTLEFNNPSLTLSFETNLKAKFEMGLNLQSGDITDSLNSPLQFEPNTSYAIDTGQLPKLREIISTPFPDELAYGGKLIFNKDDTATLLSLVNLDANYSFKIPFDFKKISLSLKDTITDLFTEDTYDDIFSHIDNVAIEAELESIDGTGMYITAAILDDTRTEISGLVETKFDGTTLSIAIKDDGAKMKKARHLAFTFRLSGANAKIKKSDFIKIKNLRLVSISGIRYEF